MTLQRSSFPREMFFQKTWRTYQAHLLETLESQLGDNRIHIVAAPGSGKTVFGIEVVRRINRPTLVLAPTITIREQWVQRVLELFLPPSTPRPDWISTDIRHPALLTVATYQALHALCSGEPDETAEGLADDSTAPNAVDDAEGENRDVRSGPKLPESLARFETLVVDEAHHLRVEWWRTLTFIARRLKPTIVALTATPPYDVAPHEWQRYEDFCGPVDAEISVPELVLQRDLCPHEDYVHFSIPAEREQRSLEAFRSAVDAFAQRLTADGGFAAALATHPYISATDAHVEEILDDPQYLSSMVVYLHAAGYEIPRRVLRALGIRYRLIPALSLDWLEILLTRCLYQDAHRFGGIAPVLTSIRRELRRIGAIERRRVVLVSPSGHAELLTTSVTKLQSIEQIVQLEAAALGDRLRCVVLTDFIRKSELPQSATDAPDFEDIGIVPIFETLRRARIATMRLGVLSGSFVVVSAACRTALEQAASALGMAAGDLSLQPLPHDPAYCSIDCSGDARHRLVRLLSDLFEDGAITVLVGTKSLLGEGWDAPAINTLVLASVVGSYVLSNQMRGRAIRVDRHHPSKNANIWHLVCVETGRLGPGADYDVLTRRCETFVGVSADSPTIENGVGRLGLGDPPFSREQIRELNARTCRRALDRDGLDRRWREALDSGPLEQMTEGVRAGPESLPRGFVFSNTIAALLTHAGCVLMGVFSDVMRTLSTGRSWRQFLGHLAIASAAGAVACLPWVVRSIWRLIRHGTPERSLCEVGAALLESLEHEGLLERPASEYRVHADRGTKGMLFCWIEGGIGRDQRVCLRALREVLRPVENSRYVLARPRVLGVFREDYFAVPKVLSGKREAAEEFARRWRRHVGAVRAIYTRTPEGRRVLLRARLHSLAAAFQKRSERISCWK